MSAQAAALLHRHFGIRAELTRLGGDRDANYHALANDGREFVFKLMHKGCEPGRVASQCLALEHLRSCPLDLPRVKKTLTGDHYTTTEDGRLAWLLTWCHGDLLSALPTHSQQLERSFGRALALLDKGLADFHHPSAEEPDVWQLTEAMVSAAHVNCVADSHRDRVTRIFDHFAGQVEARLATLPQAVIHNDANDHNVLVQDGRVSSIFDFGDMSLQPRVCDPAIALAYLVMGKSNPVATCRNFLEAYLAELPLSQSELELLFALMETRLAVSIAISSERAQREPEDPYIVISQQPAMAALDQLAMIDADHFIEAVTTRG